MLKPFLRSITISLAVAFSGCSFAMVQPVSDVGSVPIAVEGKNYKAKQEPVFEVRKYINDAGVDIFVLTEDFAMLNIESDLFMERPLQGEEKTEHRDNLLDFGFEAAQYIIPTLYGVETHELHVGNIYIGTPSMSPEGSIIMMDVRFIRDGLMYRGRVGILSSDVESNDAEDQLWFVYPMTR